MNVLTTLSATRLAQLIRSRQVSAREVVDAHIRLAQAVHPVLNALVDERFQAARAEADLADAQVRAASPESERPFHGVPCTIKECMGVAGLRQTSGLVARKDRVAERDATAVARLKQV